MDTLRENPSSSRKLADHNSTMSPRILAQPSSSDALDASPQQLEEFAPRGSGPLLDEHQVFGVKEASTRLWREGQVCLHGHRIQQELKDASYQPPIEREKFDLLNIDKLADDRRFRHALNHTAYLVFHSRTTKGQLEDNSRYCSVVVLELVLLLSNNSSQSRCSCTTGQSSLQDLQPYLNRLPDFLDAIRQLVKDLVRHEYYELVDEVLDVNLLMNQLRNRCCDLLSLMEWLGCILKESCSPIRDAQIDGTICLVMRAVDTRDGEALAFGLASLFEVFETMRLDVVNHRMRIQLPPMIDDSVEFVQRKYQDDFDHNREDSKKVWKWFHENRAFFEAIAAYVDWDWPYGEGITYDDHDVTSPDEDYLTRYIEIVLEEVVKSNKPLHELPKPFELDITRIGHIRESVTRLETEQCQVTVLNIMISQRKGATQPSSESEQHLIRRLKDINSFSEERSEGLEMAAIEIVRMAYTYAPESKSIPDPLDVCQARDMLDIQTRAGLRVATMVRETIHELISQQVFEEINGSNGICDLWPAQILKRYGSFFQTNSELDLIDSAEKVASEIRHISQQVARIALIQWRIWAQLLWFKPQAAIFATTQEYMAWQSEARIRVNERLSQHRYSSSEAYAESTIRNTDMHSSHIVKTSLPRTSDPRFSSNIMLSEHQDHSDSRYNGAVVQMT